MNKIKKRRFIIRLIILFVIGIGLFTLGFKKCDNIKYTYKENNSVDYKVYLKENNFFETSYLGKDKTYITSLIDYIDSDFSYNIDFNENVSGNLYYKVIAEIKADKNNNDVGNYWTKRYDLTNQETNNIENKNSHVININQKIDYNKYNDLLNSFIEEYQLQTESTLKVYLEVTGNVKVDNTDQTVNINSQVSLTVPLSKKAIEGKIETQGNNREKEIIKKANKVEPLRNLSRVLFVVDVFSFICNFIKYVRFLLNRNRHLSYRDTIKKLKSDYEDIITKVKSMNVNDFAVIDVETFDDLLSVYTSIREPINFLYGNEQSRFFIIKGNTCYMYTISKED